MNQDQAQGKMTQLKGKLKETWGKLSDNDMALYEGKKDQFLGKVQEAYGIGKEEAQKQLSEMETSCGCSSDNSGNTTKAA